MKEVHWPTKWMQLTLTVGCHCISEELFELVQLSGVPMDKELFKVVSGGQCCTLLLS